MKKRILSWALVLSLVLTLFAGLPLSVSANTEGIWEYEIENGEATLTGCTDPVGDLVIPDTLSGCPVTEIRYGTFYHCEDLTAITIPDSVTNIGEDTFAGLRSLTTITVDEGNMDYSSLDGILYNKDKTELIQCPAGKTGRIIIPDSVINVRTWAFYWCDRITSILISHSVTSIGFDSFLGCTGLTTITVDGDNQNYSSLAGVLYNKDKSTLIHCPKAKSGSITIPDSVTSIDLKTFSGCTNLTSVIVNAENQNYSSLGGILFNKDKTVLLRCPEGKVDGATVPSGVQNIGDFAFQGCTNLNAITLPDGVISVGANAFASCVSLTSITIPDSVTNIGEKAFYDCDALTTITIPESVTNIGGYAFSWCDNLNSIIIPNSVTEIGNSAFTCTYSLTDITLSDSVTSIGESTFSWCTGLVSVTIPNSVTSIGERAFERCTSLKSITIPDSVTIIEDYAFEACDNLTIYGYADSYAETYAIENEIPFVVLPDVPVTPPDDTDAPVTPPDDTDDPVTPPDDTDDPITPPDDTDAPVTPPDDTDDPVTPPDDTDDPVTPPDDTDDPVTPPVESIVGDLDGSEAVDVGDIMKIKDLIMKENWTDDLVKIGDLSGNGSLDVGDIMGIKNLIMSA